MYRARGWFFTLNNPTPAEKEKLEGCNPRYLIYQLEKGENGTLHYQGMVYFNNAKTMQATKKAISQRAHVEVCQNIEAAIIYCSKQETRVEGPWEFGKKPDQGVRHDLVELKDELVKRNIKMSDILMEDPMAYHQYGRTLEKIDDYVMNLKFRTEYTVGIWLWGKTKTGKSETAFEGYTPETHYILPLEDNGWWDGYKQQETVIIEDFRGQIPYDQMLRILDKYPYQVKRRHREPISFTSKTVIITCSLHPADVYHNRAEKDSIEQLLRRLVVRETSITSDHFCVV